MLRSGIVAVVLVGAGLATATTTQALAVDWSRYHNPRFSYAIDVPPGFSDVSEAQNSDGGVSNSADGKAELRVWGGYLVDRSFKSDVEERIQSDSSDDWDISYNRRTANTASWSGRKNGRVFYARAMTGCDDAAIYFRLEYEHSQLKAYDAIVSRLVKSLHRTC
ncbi:hypothetical protein [Rhizobium sp. LjRoot254]|uniref:hypothetical protein n=1 Tax=Rhizobium sp. LjRoot254 TaxID=3342297 RepID=UPI003ECC8A4B